MHGLAERGIPTFSQLGHADVERGALAAITPDLSGQLARRLALNVARMARGGDAGDLAHAMSADAELLINGETARAIGYVPDQATRMFAAFVRPEALDGNLEELDLARAMRIAEEQGTALRVQDSIVDSVRQDAAIARSFLLPQLRADLAFLATDAAFAIGPAGLATDGTTQGSLSLRQLIYDDPTWGARKAALKLVAASEAEREAVRLDVVAEAGAAFLGLAFAQALYRVDLDNLRLTDDFLELARLREEVGHSGRDEILLGAPLGIAALLLMTAACAEPEVVEAPTVVRPVKLMTVGGAGGAAAGTKSFPGRVEARKQVDLSFRVGGPLTALPIKEGQRVRKGQTLARIDPRDFQIRLKSARAQAPAA